MKLLRYPVRSVFVVFVVLFVSLGSFLSSDRFRDLEMPPVIGSGVLLALLIAILVRSVLVSLKSAREADAPSLERNAWFAQAANAVGIGVYEHDLRTGHVSWDSHMYRLFGRDPSDTFDPTTHWRGCIHPEDLPRLEDGILQAYTRGPFDTEFRVVWPSGAVRQLKATALVLRDDLGQPMRMVGVNFDITERKRTEEIARGNERFMRIVTENLPEMVAYWTADLRCRFANAAYAAWLSSTPEQLIGSGMADAIGAARFAAFRPHVTAAFAGREQRIEMTSLGEDGRVHDYWMHYLPDRVGDTTDGVISVLIDVSELKRAQAQLEELNAALQVRTRQAEGASVAKSAFLASTSHEIRTPLNAVIGLTDLLDHTELSADQATHVAKVKQAGRTLLGVIDNILDLSKIEAGEMTSESIQFDLRAQIEEILGVITVEADLKQLAVEVVFGQTVPITLFGDARQLQRVLTNLLSNAVKFTDRGRVVLDVAVTERTPIRVVLRISVRDTGVGIEPELQERVFTPFTQADASTARRYGGTGLGLSIAKSLVHLMQGSMSMASTPGVGSEFVVHLPFEIAPAESDHAPSAETGSVREGTALKGARVLVVDDSAVNLELVQWTLERHGASVMVAHNGQEAVEILSAFTHRFDAVLMDVQMPVMDGLEATHIIRHTLRLTDLPVIALTADALESERRRAIEAGMNDVITKPFQTQSIVRALASRLQSASVPSHTRALSSLESDHDVWPEVSGLDRQDTITRFGRDRQLLADVLRRFFEEYGDLEALAVATPDLAELQRRLHKLSGSAGMIGAGALRQAADAAQLAFRRDDAAGLRALASTVVPEFRRLRHSSQPLLAAAVEAAQLMEPPVARADDALLDLAELTERLQQHRIDALDLFQNMTPALELRLGPARFDSLRGALDALRYELALEILAAHGSVERASIVRASEAC